MDATDARRLKVLLTLALPACLAFLGLRQGCDSGPMPEHKQVLRPGRPSDVPPAPSEAPSVPATPVSRPTPPIPGAARDFTIVFWNLENFFDDQDDHRAGQGDKEYDSLFAKHPDLFRLKLDKLCDGILSFGGGRGPDILAAAEVEGVHAAQALQTALNARLPDPALHYRNLVMKEMNSGRHIAPAILTRLPVDASRTRAVGSRQRIIEGHVVVDNHELVLIVGHWTSRLQKDGPAKRMEYAEKMYGEANALYHANPKADVLLCGDFNDNPTDPSVVQGLRSVNDPRGLIAPDGQLRLLNLFAAWTPKSRRDVRSGA